MLRPVPCVHEEGTPRVDSPSGQVCHEPTRTATRDHSDGTARGNTSSGKNGNNRDLYNYNTKIGLRVPIIPFYAGCRHASIVKPSQNSWSYSTWVPPKFLTAWQAELASPTATPKLVFGDNVVSFHPNHRYQRILNCPSNRQRGFRMAVGMSPKIDSRNQCH